MEPNNVSGPMDFIKKLNLTPLLILKVTGVAIVGLVLLTFAFQLVGSSFHSLSNTVGESVSLASPISYGRPGVGGGSYAVTVSSANYDAGYGSKGAFMAPSMPSLSARNAASTMPYPQPAPQPAGGVPGDTAEAFEVTQYNASVETRHLADTCSVITSLKPRTDVIFENANTGDRNCSFTFKVKHASVEEILAIVKALNPKELSENTSTIKRQLDDYTNEVDVLLKKRASIDETLKSAINAYNEVTTLATRSQNADALAKIIDSKIQVIERLTQERININTQLDQLSRSKADQLDRLDYTYFYVNVFENKFVDWQSIKDSWKASVQQFFYNLNKVVQDMTLNLILLLLFVAQWLLYAVIVLFVAKYGWKFTKYIWLR